jgi:hypothetical protein
MLKEEKNRLTGEEILEHVKVMIDERISQYLIAAQHDVGALEFQIENLENKLKVSLDQGLEKIKYDVAYKGMNEFYENMKSSIEHTIEIKIEDMMKDMRITFKEDEDD